MIRPLILLGLAFMLFAGGCGQQPKQMELCEYYLWSTQEHLKLVDHMVGANVDLELAAQVAREIESQPAPELAQPYKEAILNEFAKRSTWYTASTEIASATAVPIETEEAHLAGFIEFQSLRAAREEEFTKLAAFCPQEADAIQKLISE